MNSPPIIDNKRVRWVLFFSWCAIFLHLCSLDLYNPSLPAMAQDLQVSQRMVRGLVVTYLLGFSLSQLVYGAVSDALGRRKIFIFCVSFLMLSNFLTATAHTATQLLVYRGLTGLVSGGCAIVSRSVLRDYIPEKGLLLSAFSKLNMLNAIGPAFAPILGGWVQVTYGWRLNFVTLGALCLLGLIIVCLFFKETHHVTKPFSFKDSVATYRSLIGYRDLWAYSIISSLAFCCSMGYFTISPFIYQKVFHWTAFENGLVYVFYAVPVSLGSLLTVYWSTRRSPQKILFLSSLGLMTVSLLFLLLERWSGWQGLVLFSSFIGFFVGVLIPLGQSMSVYPFSESVGSASAVSGCIRMLCSSLWLFILVFFHINTLLGLAYVFLANSTAILIFHLFVLGRSR